MPFTARCLAFMARCLAFTARCLVFTARCRWGEPPHLRPIEAMDADRREGPVSGRVLDRLDRCAESEADATLGQRSLESSALE